MHLQLSHQTSKTLVKKHCVRLASLTIDTGSGPPYTFCPLTYHAGFMQAGQCSQQRSHNFDGTQLFTEAAPSIGHELNERATCACVYV